MSELKQDYGRQRHVHCNLSGFVCTQPCVLWTIRLAAGTGTPVTIILTCTRGCTHRHLYSQCLSKGRAHSSFMMDLKTRCGQQGLWPKGLYSIINTVIPRLTNINTCWRVPKRTAFKSQLRSEEAAGVPVRKSGEDALWYCTNSVWQQLYLSQKSPTRTLKLPSGIHMMPAFHVSTLDQISVLFP